MVGYGGSGRRLPELEKAYGWISRKLYAIVDSARIYTKGAILSAWEVRSLSTPHWWKLLKSEGAEEEMRVEDKNIVFKRKIFDIYL